MLGDGGGDPCRQRRVRPTRCAPAASVRGRSGIATKKDLNSNSDMQTLFLTPDPCPYPLTETPEKEITARPRTGWPKKRAGSKTLKSRTFSTSDRVASSFGPETMR